jgi:hypothetical protein
MVVVEPSDELELKLGRWGGRRRSRAEGEKEGELVSRAERKRKGPNVIENDTER